MVFAIVLMLAQAVAAPEPTASPGELPWLKTIVTVKTNPVCSVLRDVVAPAIEDLRLNDAGFAQSTSFFLDATRHTNAGHQGMVEIDMMRLGTEESDIAESIIRIDTVLADRRLMQNGTQTDRELFALKGHLEHVLAIQKDALNIISGTVETHALALLLQVGDASTSEPEIRVTRGYLDSGQEREAVFAPLVRTSALSISGFNSEMLRSSYYHNAQAIALGQLAERPAETDASRSVLQLVETCRSWDR